jgi:beta-lactamase regulating signal transducer with metallopeptidase domain
MIPTMIEAALRSLLLALAVWAGLRACRVRNVLAQKACWGSVLAASLLMPFIVRCSAQWQVLPANATISLPMSFHTAIPAPEPLQFTTPSNTPAAIQFDTDVADKDFLPTSKSAGIEKPSAEQFAESTPDLSATTSSPVITGVYGGVPSTTAPAHQARHRESISLLSIAWILYIIVAGALTLRVLYGLASALLLWLNAEPIPAADAAEFGVGMPVRSSRSVASPVTIGSAVILPHDYASWDAEKLRIVLAHERSHIRQGDFYLQLLAAFYAAIFWVSPLGWWLKRELSDLAETISDRAGLEQAASLTSYAQILLEFAAAPRPTPVGVAMARRASLSRRIERLLNDSSFKQAFAGGRRRALVAVLLVPMALFAATCLVRVQAAQQAQNISEPTPAPAAQPTPEAAAQSVSQAKPSPAHLSDAAQPDVEIDAPEDEAPQVIAIPRLPKVVVVPPIPQISVVVPKIPMPKVVVVPRVPSVAIPKIVIPPIPPMIALLQDDVSKALRQNGYHYRYSIDGDSYTLVTGDHRDHYQFSGDIHTSQIDKARKLAHGDFLWFEHDDKEYFVDDPATIAQIEAMYKPIDELGKQQEALGKQQEELGNQQEALGRLQEQATVPTPDMRKEMAELNEAMAKVQAKIGKTITQEELSDLEGKLGELEGRLGELQGEIGGKQGELGAQQGELGAQQGKLGAEQGRLGAQQGRLSREADRKVHDIIEESLHNGKAHPVE